MLIRSCLSTTNTTTSIGSAVSRPDVVVSTTKVNTAMSRRKPRSHAGSDRQTERSFDGSTRSTEPAVDDPTLVYGRHAVRAALHNDRRHVVAIRHTVGAGDAMAVFLSELPEPRRRSLPAPQPVDATELDASLPDGAVHQGLVLKVTPLPDPNLSDLIVAWEGRTDIVLVVLDQVTDPHNVGAVLRSAAAFGASAVVLQDRHGPPVTGVLAKIASGALDVVPLVRVVNLARALRDLQENGFWCTGLAEDGSVDLGRVDLGGRCAIVLGAEGAGLRRLTRETCDALARLPTCPPIGSLNVSAAAAVALYQARLARTGRDDLQLVNG
jgi:23S rRNA (guanosine2251-2'-O)-methyltransferase